MQKIQSLKEMKAAIFDMDGTLTDSAGMWLEARTAFFEAYGIQGTPGQVARMISMAIDGASRYAIKAFGLTQSLEEISQFWRDYAGRRYATDIPLKPGVKAYFDKLKANGRAGSARPRGLFRLRDMCGRNGRGQVLAGGIPPVREAPWTACGELRGVRGLRDRHPLGVRSRVLYRHRF